METAELVGLILVLVGLVDFVVVPRLLVAHWRRQGQSSPTHAHIVTALRISGALLVALGVLLYRGILAL